MLVLSRFPKEKIIIDTGNEIIEIVVADVRNRQVRIGIKADDHVEVHREEVYERINGNR